MADGERPLDGLRIVVTRSKAQSSVLTDKLVALGATPVGVATIEIVAPGDGGAALRRAASSLGRYAQIVVSSPNGARTLVAAVAANGQVDEQNLPPVACVGPSTAAQFADGPLTVNVVPERAVAEGLVEAMSDPAPNNNRLLLVQAEVSRDVLEKGLTSKGWNVDRVTAYRTIDAAVSEDERAQARGADVVTFTSSSTVERFLRLVGADVVPPAVVSIGPITSATARDFGLHVDIEADPHTIDGLVDAVVAWARSR